MSNTKIIVIILIIFAKILILIKLNKTYIRRSKLDKDYILRKHIPDVPDLLLCVYVNYSNEIQLVCTSTVTEHKHYLSKNDFKYLKNEMFMMMPASFKTLQKYVNDVEELK